MSGDFIIMGSLAVAATVAVVGAFSFPELTSAGPSEPIEVGGKNFEAVYNEELDHCREQPESYDCRCFARISGIIQSGREVKVEGAIHANRRELARTQASGSC